MADEPMNPAPAPGGAPATATAETGTQENLTYDCFVKYVDDTLTPKINNAESALTVACTDYDNKLSSRAYKNCLVVQAESAHDEYTNIQNYITTFLQEDASLVNGNIKQLKTNSEELGKSLSAAVTEIKKVKDKLSEANKAACKLKNAKTDPCHSEQLKALEAGIKEVTDENGDVVQQSFCDAVDEIVEATEALAQNANDAFEYGVKVSGIYAFTNVASLEGFGSNLSEEVDQLNSDIEGNIKYDVETLQAAQKDLTQVLKELRIAAHPMAMAKAEKDGLHHTEAYALDQEHQVPNTIGPVPPDYIDPADFSQALSDICDKVEASFTKTTV